LSLREIKVGPGWGYSPKSVENEVKIISIADYPAGFDSGAFTSSVEFLERVEEETQNR